MINQNRMISNVRQGLANQKSTGLAVRKTNVNTTINQNGLAVKRNALSHTTNLIHKPKEDENSKQDQVKVSATEVGFTKPQLKPLANKINIANNRSKVETRSSLKLDTTLSKIPKPLSKDNSKDRSIREKSVVKSKPAPAQEKLVPIGLSFSSFIIPENVENIDENDLENNALLVPTLANDIYMYIRHLEDKLALREDFLSNQIQLTPRMRSRIVDWIMSLSYKFELLSETLYLTIRLMDRFFEKEVVSKDKIQLCAGTAFFIACKYEEIYPPQLKAFMDICASSKSELLKMEMSILRVLKFDLSYPLPLHFLRRFSKAAHATSEIHTMAKYIMELSLLEYACSHWKPSLLAAASLYLTLQLIAQDKDWNDTLVFYSNYKEEQLLPHVSTLCKLLLKIPASNYQNCVRKYDAQDSKKKQKSVSKSPALSSDYVKEMATMY